MGKHNIAVEETDGVSAEFESDSRRVVVALKENILDQMRSCSEDDEKFK